jgi:hypothetical protein
MVSSSVASVKPSKPPVIVIPTSFGGSIYSITSKYISCTASKLQLSTNFTYELWFYSTSNFGTQGLFGHGPNTTGSIRMFYNFPGGSYQNKISVQIAQANGTLQLTSTSTVTNNTWMHVALVRNNADVTLFINGVSEATLSGYNLTTTPSSLVLFRDYTDISQEYFSGYITGFRLSNRAIYTTNFTPDKYQYTITANTIVALPVASSTAPLLDSASIPPLIALTFSTNGCAYNTNKPT